MTPGSARTMIAAAAMLAEMGGPPVPVPGEGGPSLKGLRPAPPWPKLNVGRNDPCPCGSGKKFKRCCL